MKTRELHLHTYAAPAYLSQHGIPAHPQELENPPQRVVGYLWAHKNQPFPYAMRLGQELVHIN